MTATSAPHWPWMATVQSRIHTPTKPIDELDRRPAVCDLIDRNREALDQLGEAISDDPLFQPSKHDDLWLLRFLLSHKMKHDKALNAAKYTLQFRHKHRLDEFDIRTLNVNNHRGMNASNSHPYVTSLRKFLSHCDDNAFLSYVPDAQRGVIFMIQLSGRDQYRLVKELSEEEYFEAFLISTEWIFQWLDTTTRATGLLTKCLRLADAKGVSFKMQSKENKMREAKNGAVCEDVYPQLLASLLVINAPIWADIVFALVKPFTPKRVLEKVGLVKPLQKQKDLDRILEHCCSENLPRQYGGDLEEKVPKKLVPQLLK